VSIVIADLECPACGAVHDRVAGNPVPPVAGDVSVCIDCGCIRQHTDAGALRVVPEDELAHPDWEPARRARAAIRTKLGWPTLPTGRIS
jgi:hypothetical protein